MLARKPKSLINSKNRSCGNKFLHFNYIRRKSCWSWIFVLVFLFYGFPHHWGFNLSISYNLFIALMGFSLYLFSHLSFLSASFFQFSPSFVLYISLPQLFPFFLVFLTFSLCILVLILESLIPILCAFYKLFPFSSHWLDNF